MSLRFLFIASAVALALSTGCKKQTASKAKITGGRVDETSFPPGVLLLIKKDGQLSEKCTGTIVRNDLVLTAGHCHAPQSSDSFVLGDTLDDLAPEVETSTIITFPGFAVEGNALRNLGKDVAFAVFPKNTFRDKFVAKISQKSPEVGNPISFIGYGQTEVNNTRSNSNNDRYRGSNKVALVSPLLADAIIIYTRAIGSSTAASNSGDSGGPVFNDKPILFINPST